MKKCTKYYNIHTILSIKLTQPRWFTFIPDINFPYSYFETASVTTPDIIFNLGPFKPQHENCAVIDHTWYIKKDYIYCSERLGRITCEVQMRGFEAGPITVNVNTTIRKLRQVLYPSVLSQYIILRPLIDYVLLHKGYLSVHAAGVAQNGRALILLGRGGSHKTSLVMDLIRKEQCQYLGEDRVIIKDKTVYSYPLHYKLFDYRLQRMKSENYGLLDKLRYALYQRRACDVSQYVADTAKLDAICCIVKAERDDVRIARLTQSDVINKTVISQTMENIKGAVILGLAKGLHDYFTAYAYVFPDSAPARYMHEYEKQLTQCLPNRDYCEIELPQRYSDAALYGLLAAIKPT